MVQDRTI